ncbi:MAG: hypothetical protein ACI9LE_000230 [Paraglaciecola sp.]|jgi:hypothetical protein
MYLLYRVVYTLMWNCLGESSLKLQTSVTAHGEQVWFRQEPMSDQLLTGKLQRLMQNK